MLWNNNIIVLKCGLKILVNGLQSSNYRVPRGWEFVKGEKNENEGVEECAVREANEETGLNIVKVEQIPFHYSYDYLKGLDNFSANVSCFIAETDEELVSLSDEHNYYKWVSLDRGLGLLEFDEQKKLLEYAGRIIQL